jgi:hypothetical protein
VLLEHTQFSLIKILLFEGFKVPFDTVLKNLISFFMVGVSVREESESSFLRITASGAISSSFLTDFLMQDHILE